MRQLTGANPPVNQYQEKQKNKKCVYCNGNHKPEQCQKISSVEAGTTVLIHDRKCFNCFGNGNMSKICFSKKRCLNSSKNITPQSVRLCTKDHPPETRKRKKPATSEGNNKNNELERTSNSHQDVTIAGNKDLILMPSVLITVYEQQH